MRRLIYVPIIHTMADMGSKSEAFRQEYIRRFGVEGWARSRWVINDVWDGIRAKLMIRNLPWEWVKIYQDGLPVSGKELDIAREVAAQGSKNYQIVLELVDKGAKLIGTESPALLLQEYAHVKQIAEAQADAEREEATRSYTAESAKILEARDAFIAQRIAETLKEGEVGLLFLGMMHEVDRLLPEGIEVEFLIDRLPLWDAEER